MKTANKKSKLIQPSAQTLNTLIDHMQLTDYAVKNKKTVLLPSHPHVTYLEEKIKELEGGENALVLESLAEARYLLFKTLLRPGDNVVSFNSWSLYFNDDANYKNSGISIRLSVDGKIETLNELIDDHTKIIYLETVSNEFMNIPDFRKISAIAKERNIPLIVDNTAGGPGYLTSPIRYGANLVLLDTTPWLLHNKKHAGAAIIEDGNYQWRNKNFDHLLNDENSKKSYSGKEDKKIPNSGQQYYFSLLDYIKQSMLVETIDLTIAPNWHYDIENIDYILFRKSENTALLSAWLKKQEPVAFINYLGFPDNENHWIASSLFKGGYGNTFSFKLNTTIFSDDRFIKKLKTIDIPPYLLRIYFDSDLATVVVSVGYGDFEELKRFFQLIFETVTTKELVTKNGRR
jgi:O-acetylhomoserine/O-acetylserine sulfhydrylase